MKKLILSFLYGTSVLIILAGLILVSPYYYYNEILKKEYSSEWFNLTSFEENFIKPSRPIEVKEPNLGNDDLWKKYHIKDTYIPLPNKNPFFFVAPLLVYEKNEDITNFGVSVFGTSKLEISKVFFMNNRFLPSVIRSQELFKLPLVKNIIKKKSADDIWKDVFTRDLSKWDVSYSDLLYQLYILQLRSVLLPNKFKTFALVDEKTGLVEMFSTDKDYKTELVLTKQRGLIYSYLIVTDLNNQESQVLRYKFLKEISFRPSSEALADILYKEFKALSFKEQTGQIGMMYLLSAYSHRSSREFIREMITYLERGDRNQTPLKRLYEFSQKRYGETFTKKLIEGIKLEDELDLKRNIELEDKKNLEELARENSKVKKDEKTEDEKYQDKIKRAKESKKVKDNRMIID